VKIKIISACQRR